jgi:hypothetical protein
LATDDPPLRGDSHVAEFQARQREFQPLWRKTVGLGFFPGFLLFALGAYYDNRWLAIPGILFCLAGAVRAALLVLRYRRCPGCGAIQMPKVYYPYRECRACGARLSVGAKDSM